MRSVVIICIIILIFAGCRRVLFQEYRHKDYYLITGGTHYFFDKNSISEKEVKNQKTLLSDTCSCILGLKYLSEKEYLNQLLLGMRFSIKSHSRDFYSSFPHDNSIEDITGLSVFVQNKKEKVDITRYLNNEKELRDAVIFRSVYSSSNMVGKSVSTNTIPECSVGFSVKNVQDFLSKFNNNKFDNGLETIDSFIFLLKISSECPYKIADFDEILTSLELCTNNTKRNVSFKTKLN